MYASCGLWPNGVPAARVRPVLGIMVCAAELLLAAAWSAVAAPGGDEAVVRCAMPRTIRQISWRAEVLGY